MMLSSGHDDTYKSTRSCQDVGGATQRINATDV